MITLKANDQPMLSKSEVREQPERSSYGDWILVGEHL